MKLLFSAKAVATAWLLSFALLVTPVTATWKGFNIKSNLADGTTCKSRADWGKVFRQLKTFPNKINSARLFSAHACSTLENAVPEAIATSTYLLVGLTDDDTSFPYEKQALYEAIQKYGLDWIVAIAVGSESLYRHATSPAALIPKIQDIRGMVKKLQQAQGSKRYIEVGHVDTTNVWFNASNAALIRACDFIGMNVYPYFQKEQNNDISQGKMIFDAAVAQAKRSVAKAKSAASVWITESGWPINGNQVGNAKPSVENAETYFKDVACSAFDSMNTFWFQYQDWYAVPSFAVVDAAGKDIYSQSCV